MLLGWAVSEVMIDILTGMYTLIRTDIVHDVGDSIGGGDRPWPEPGRIHCRCRAGYEEEMKWMKKGRQLTILRDTYKFLRVNDIPGDFRVEIPEDVRIPEPFAGAKRGEPPFMLAFRYGLPLKDAISAVRKS